MNDTASPAPMQPARFTPGPQHPGRRGILLVAPAQVTA